MKIPGFRLSKWSGTGLLYDAANVATSALAPTESYNRVLAGAAFGLGETMLPALPGSLKSKKYNLNTVKALAKSALVVGVSHFAGPVAGIAAGLAASVIDRGLTEGRALESHRVNLETMEAPQAWSQGYDGTGVTIAVLDSGGQARQEFGDRLVAFKRFDGGDESKVVDNREHGTAMTSVAAATGEISGVAPGANLAVLKVTDDQGVYRPGLMIQALEWVEQNQQKHNIGVVSMSFGSPIDVPQMTEVLDRLDQKGVVSLAAAGNGGYREKIDFPSNQSSVIGIGNLDDRNTSDPADDRVDRTSTRPTVDGVAHAEALAPGRGWVSAAPRGTFISFHNGGSSSGTAATAGAVAIWKQARPDLDSAGVRELLKESSQALENTPAREQGHGSVKIARGLEKLLEQE